MIHMVCNAETMKILVSAGYKCLNVGSNCRIVKGAVNLDIKKFKGVNIVADLTKKLPIKTDTYDFILAENVLEHIPKNKVDFTVKELHRVLKPKGVILIACPHFTSSCYFINQHYGNFGCLWSIKSYINNFFGKTDLPTETQKMFKLLKVKLVFPKSNFRFYNYLLEWIVNINQKTIMIYEESPLRVFNAGGIHFYLQKNE